MAREEISVSEYENAATSKSKERIVFTLQPKIVHVSVNGKTEATLAFQCAKEFETLPGGDKATNVLGAIYRSLKVEQGETAVITKIERVSVVNEMPVFDLNFDLLHVFDEDAQKQVPDLFIIFFYFFYLSVPRQSGGALMNLFMQTPWLAPELQCYLSSQRNHSHRGQRTWTRAFAWSLMKLTRPLDGAAQHHRWLSWKHLRITLMRSSTMAPRRQDKCTLRLTR